MDRNVNKDLNGDLKGHVCGNGGISIGVIIPAYNEEGTVAPVVKAALEVTPHVIVVDDGSSDATSEAATGAGARVIRLDKNRGKGAAMQEGLSASPHGIIVFLDADLIGLGAQHIHALVDPVIGGRADMTVGVFTGGRAVTDLAQKISPWLSGQRACRRWVLEDVDMTGAGFGVEIMLTNHAKHSNARVLMVPLLNVTQRMKEEKRGLLNGVVQRSRMYWEVVKQAISK